MHEHLIVDYASNFAPPAIGTSRAEIGGLTIEEQKKLWEEPLNMQNAGHIRCYYNQVEIVFYLWQDYFCNTPAPHRIATTWCWIMLIRSSKRPFASRSGRVGPLSNALLKASAATTRQVT